MSNIVFHPGYWVCARWFGRQETSDGLGDRLGLFIDRLSGLHATLVPWWAGLKSPPFQVQYVPYEDARHDLGAYIERNVKRCDDGSVEPNTGYSFWCSSRDERQIFGIRGSVGSIVGPTRVGPMSNDIDFHTTTTRSLDPNIVTYDLIKAALLAMIECWEPRTCFAKPTFCDPSWERAGDGIFARAWMTYVTPDDIGEIDVGGVPIVDPTPDGGLLLSATDALFDVRNPSHLAGAEQIARATQPLNAAFPVWGQRTQATF